MTFLRWFWKWYRPRLTTAEQIRAICQLEIPR